MSTSTGNEEPPQRKPRRPRTIIGVVGELLITVSVLILMFIGWQMWWNPLVLAGQQTDAAAAQSRQWIDEAKSTPTPTPSDTSAAPTASPTTTPPPAAPPVMKPVKAAQAFGVLYVPRFGENYKRVIKETVDEKTVLNSYTSGIGHYPGTQMPGEVGNFAIAGHDTGWGNALIDITKLQLGDKIYIQTKDGWYTYQFRNFEYVQPNAVDVLWPVPRVKGAPGDRLLTITTCNPPWHSVERVITYATFDSFRPISAGAPSAIVSAVSAK